MFLPPELNYLAVLVAGIAAFAIGALWYTVLFGKQWVAAHGYTLEQQEAMKGNAMRAYAVSLLCYIIMALALAILIYLTGIIRPVGGLKLGLLAWAGFAAPVGLTANVYSNKPFSTFLIDAGYQLVILMAMGWILAAWR